MLPKKEDNKESYLLGIRIDPFRYFDSIPYRIQYRNTIESRVNSELIRR